MRRVLLLLLLLLAANAILAANAEHWRFKYIVVHHSATRTGDYATIKAMHARRGWDDAAYQLILSNGSKELPAGALEATGRYRDLSPGPATRNQPINLSGIHICIIGNYQADEFPDAMKPALGHVLRELSKRFDVPEDHIIFHRDASPSVCPGKHIQKREMLRWMHELADDCPPGIAAQQDRVLNTASLDLRTYPRFLLLVHAVLSGLLVLLWWIVSRAMRSRSRANRHTDRSSFRDRSPVRRKSRRNNRPVRYPRPR